MPTLTASTPRSISASVASAVATLPAMMSMSLKRRGAASARCRARPASGRARCRSTSTSTWARDQRLGALAACRARCRRPRRSAAGPSESLHAFGYLIAFWMSLTVMRPLSRKSRSTTRSFSTLCWCRISRASSSVVPTGTVMRFSLVITSRDRPVDVGLEAQVAVGEDADEPSFLAAVLGDRHAGDAVLLHQLERFADAVRGGERDRVDDHAALRALHAVDFGAPAPRSTGSCG